jgi:molybdopterin-synthase adenylyltransferase
MTTETAYDRQRLIPGWRQDRLASATVVVAGVGAVGNEVAKNLALAGVGRLILCDPDTVSVSNLSRTVLFTARDVGRAKAEVAAESLRRLVPAITADPRNADLVSGVGLGELADAGVILGCVDTVRARMQLLGRCALVNAPMVDAGTQPWGGEVRLRASADDPCYACTLTEGQRGQSDLPWSCHEEWETGPEPASIVTAALVAAWAATAAIGLLMEMVPPWHVMSVETSGGAAPIEIARDPGCPYHRPWPDRPEVIPASSASTVAELLATLQPGDDPEGWVELRLPAHCRVCGDRPADADTSRRRCRNCGALLKPVMSLRLRDGDLGSPLSRFGVAPEEILPVRNAEGVLRCVRLSHS